MIERIRALLEPSLPLNHIELRDTSRLHADHYKTDPDATVPSHLELTVVCEAFRDRSQVACHRQVYDLLQPLWEEGLHALSLRLLTPPQRDMQDPDA